MATKLKPVDVVTVGVGLTGYNPTGTVGALTFHTLEAIKSKYLKQPGPLA